MLSQFLQHIYLGMAWKVPPDLSPARHPYEPPRRVVSVVRLSGEHLASACVEETLEADVLAGLSWRPTGATNVGNEGGWVGS